jgi:predicted amidohydrolase YtcJ
VVAGSDYAEHAEHEKGKVREGRLADLAVVDLETVGRKSDRRRRPFRL